MLFGKHVNKYYLKYAVFFIIGIIALIAVDYFQLLIPGIYETIIDGLADGTLFNDSGKSDKLFRLMLQLGGIAAIMFAGRFSWRYCIFGVGVRIEADMRDAMYVHSEKLSTRFYKEHKTGGLMAYFTNDLQTIRMAFGQGTIMLIDAVFLGIMALIFMFKSNVMLTILSFIPMVLIAVLSLFIGRIMQKKFKMRQKAYEDLSDFSQENFSGINVVKAFVKEINEIRAFAKINKNNYDKNVEFVRFASLLNVLLTVIISSIIGIILGYGGYLVLFSDVDFTVGNLLAFIAYFNTLTWPMMAIGQLINMRAQAKASLSRISELLDEPIEIVDPEDADPQATVSGKIQFNHLNFRYPDGTTNVLSDISFTIERGEMVGIIGKTGCGKTTIVDLLLRVYNIEPNTILLDDKDIMKIPFKVVRDNIGYVPQDNFLFSDTIKNNIAFAYEDIQDEKVQQAASLADVHSNIVEFENQYQTVVGERGVTLSGGQKQRVSIARALIKDPNILIFDDSVSAVDTKTEEKILENLRRLRCGQTTIMIAHRISTVRDLDKIILLDDGKVVAVGTHDELVANCEMYKEMVRLQTLEQEVDGGDYLG